MIFFHLYLSGWLHKEMSGSNRVNIRLKKRWFLLTHNSLDYYKNSERNSLKLGSILLNSLCSVLPPDERVNKETGMYKNAQAEIQIQKDKHC